VETVQAKGIRKNDLMKEEVEEVVKGEKVPINDLDRDIMKTVAKKSTETKSQGRTKAMLHRVNSREFAIRTSQMLPQPDRVT
jgi:hypothetical protein